MLPILQLHSQSNPSYPAKLAATCKVWGFLKYFHDGPSNCRVNWDSVLVSHLPAVKSATTLAEFNSVLSKMISAAGDMPAPQTPPVTIPPGNNTNLNTAWFHQPIFDPSVSAGLDTIRNRFRPHPICTVKDGNASTGWIDFEDASDTTYIHHPVYPNESGRLLMAFRYWNYIEYFFNGKSLMDVSWDSTLVRKAPLIANASSDLEYHLAFLELVSGLNDTHASYSGSAIVYDHFGRYTFPFYAKYIEKKLVVVAVWDTSIHTIKVGDIITKLDGIDIDTGLNRRIKYISNSNPAALYRDLLEGSKNILLGPSGSTAVLTVQSGGTATDISLQRDMYLPDFLQKLNTNTHPNFEALPGTKCKIGYINMGLLMQGEEKEMYSKLNDAEALIFDIRNYPNGTAWNICPLLTDAPYGFAKDYIPSLQYPGILKEIFVDSVYETNSRNPYKKPIYLLVNEQTQSQAEYTAMMISLVPGTSVKVVGSQTAGADGNITVLALPGGLRTYFSTLGIFYPDGTGAQRKGVKIDYEVKPTIEGIKQGKDELLDYVLNLISCSSAGVAPKDAPSTTFQVFPNPARTSANIRFEIPSAQHVSLALYDVMGKLISCPVNGEIPAGTYDQVISTEGLTEGLYCIKLEINGKVLSSKMLVQR